MGWYRFLKDKVKGQLRIDKAQVAWYDMERGGSCFDESWIIHKGNDRETLESIGMWLTYVELDESADKCDKSRVFIHMDDVERYELKLIKLDKNKRYSKFYDK